MIKVLIIHKTELTNQAYINRILEKYPILKENPDIWKLKAYKIGTRQPQYLKKGYDRLYWDKDTVSQAELLDYSRMVGYPLAYPVTLSDKPIVNTTKVTTQVQKLSTKKIKRKKHGI